MGGALRRGPGARVQARLSAGERRDQYLRKRRAPQQPSVRSLAVPLSNDAPVPAVVQGGREKDVGEEAQTIGRGTTTREAAQEIARNVPGVIEHPIQKGRIPRTVAAALHYNLQKSRHISLNTDSFCRSPESRLYLKRKETYEKSMPGENGSCRFRGQRRDSCVVAAYGCCPGPRVATEAGGGQGGIGEEQAGLGTVCLDRAADHQLERRSQKADDVRSAFGPRWPTAKNRGCCDAAIVRRRARRPAERTRQGKKERGVSGARAAARGPGAPIRAT